MGILLSPGPVKLETKFTKEPDFVTNFLVLWLKNKPVEKRQYLSGYLPNYFLTKFYPDHVGEMTGGNNDKIVIIPVCSKSRKRFPKGIVMKGRAIDVAIIVVVTTSDTDVNTTSMVGASTATPLDTCIVITNT